MVRSSPEWVWWNESVLVSFSAAASWTEPAAASSTSEARPIRDPTFTPAWDNDNAANWRAKPASTYEPTQSTSVQNGLSRQSRYAKESERFVKTRRLIGGLPSRPPNQVRMRT